MANLSALPLLRLQFCEISSGLEVSKGQFLKTFLASLRFYAPGRDVLVPILCTRITSQRVLGDTLGYNSLNTDPPKVKPVPMESLWRALSIGTGLVEN